MGPRLPKLRVVSNYGVGVDHIDVEAARRLNIPVGNTPHVLNGATADQAMTLLLAAGRAVIELSNSVHQIFEIIHFIEQKDGKPA